MEGEEKTEGVEEGKREVEKTRKNGIAVMGEDRDREQGKIILIEVAVMGLARSLALETFPEIHKNDPS